jgi:hypothetical protein
VLRSVWRSSRRLAYRVWSVSVCVVSSDNTDNVFATSSAFSAVKGVVVGAAAGACVGCKSFAARSLVRRGSGLLSRLELTLTLLLGDVIRNAAGTTLAWENVGEGNEGRIKPTYSAGEETGCEVSGLPWCDLLVGLSIDSVLTFMVGISTGL